MIIKPDYMLFEKLAQEGNLIPLFTEIPVGLHTPLSVFRKIDDGKSSFILESVEGGERWAARSFLGSHPRIIVSAAKGTVAVIEGETTKILHHVKDPTCVVKEILDRFHPVAVNGLPDFFGGAVGFISYDMVRGFERIPDLDKPCPGFQDMWFMFTRDMVVFDNLAHKILLITTVSPDEATSARDAYTEGCSRLTLLKEQLDSSPPPLRKTAVPVGEPRFSSNMPESEFHRAVLEAKRHIHAGDIIQVVLSHRFQADTSLDALDIYRGLRMINPSPYMFYLQMADECLAGSSPEVMVRLGNKEVAVRPIAGTRPRGKTLEHDVELARELLADEKEIAEHVMLVDLARNDVGRIAEPGSVTVDEFKTIERYSHVMHIVSNVRARPANSTNAFEVLRATFPAGTVTGAPKIRAMEIIEELEPEHRGPYGGCVGYVSYTGFMDMAITIRTVMMKKSRAYFQAGAGIVADSDPEREYQETLNKAEAMRKAVAVAGTLQGSLK